jgi:hypothetical protein
MTMAQFYGYFASAYGTFWFCLMLLALLTQKHINAGEFGFFGFPILAFLYALIRMGAAASAGGDVEFLKERIRWLEAELARRGTETEGGA